VRFTTNLTADDAASILDEQAPGRPAFVEHSHVVSGVARRIALALRESEAGIDVERIAARAMLHDFGRSCTHGNYHGWVGYAMLRRRGLAHYARGCVTHWLRGLPLEEVLHLSPSAKPQFMKRVFDELDLPQMTDDDLVVSVADFSVAHTNIVPLEERERDLVVRYGDSRWLRRSAEIARAHRDELERRTGLSLDQIVPELGKHRAAEREGTHK